MKSRIETMLIVLFLAATTAFGWYKMSNHLSKAEASNEVLRQFFVKGSSKVALLRIVHEKMPNLPTETQVKLTDTIFAMSELRQVPLSLVCGLIETESGWKESIVSGANAKGLMQLLPSTARPYLRAERLNYAENTLYDPVVNVIVGISFLADLQEGHVEAGKAKKDDWTFALHSYFWGPSGTALLYGKKDLRANTPNLAYPIRVMGAAKGYREKGL